MLSLIDAAAQQRRRRRFFLALISSLLLLPLLHSVQAQASQPVYQLELNGILSDYHVDYVERVLREAVAADAAVVILAIRTDGARLTAARRLAESIAAAAVPVAVAVRTAEGDAAGAWLSAAAHLAVLEQGSRLGVSQPLAALPGVVSDAEQTALIRAQSADLTQWQLRHGRDLQWLRDGLLNGVVLDSTAAAGGSLVDAVIAPAVDVAALVTGRTVRMADGSERTIMVSAAEIRRAAATPWEAVRLFLADPTIVFLLFVLAILAIMVEIVSPTFGILSSLALFLTLAATIGLWVLPVHWFALLGMIGAAALMGLDIVIPSAGLLTAGGLLLLIGSAMNLYDTQQVPGATVAWWAIAMVALLVVAVGLSLGWLIWRTHRRKVSTGSEGLIGCTAEVRQALTPQGMVYVDGALWRATCQNGSAEEGMRVEVVAVQGLGLTVRIGAASGSAVRKESNYGS